MNKLPSSVLIGSALKFACVESLSGSRRTHSKMLVNQRTIRKYAGLGVMFWLVVALGLQNWVQHQQIKAVTKKKVLPLPRYGRHGFAFARVPALSSVRWVFYCFLVWLHVCVCVCVSVISTQSPTWVRTQKLGLPMHGNSAFFWVIVMFRTKKRQIKSAENTVTSYSTVHLYRGSLS